VAELDPSLIPVLKYCGFVDISSVYGTVFTILGLNDDLFSVWLQIHACNQLVRASDESPIFLEQNVVQKEGGPQKQRIGDDGGNISHENALDEGVVENAGVEEGDSTEAILAPFDVGVFISVGDYGVYGTEAGVLDEVHFLEGLNHRKVSHALLNESLSFYCCG